MSLRFYVPAQTVFVPSPGASTDARPNLQALIDAADIANGGSGSLDIQLGKGTFLLNSTGPLRIPRSGTADIQTITTTGTPGGGTFTLTFGGATTGTIVYNASATVVAAALNLLAPIAALGGVQCTGGALPTGVVVRFNSVGAQSLMTSTDSLTGGTAPATVITHTTTGTGSPSNAIRIRGSGRGVTIVKLGGATNSRFVDVNRVADHDWFENVEISDLTVDVNSVAGDIQVIGTTVQRPNLRNWSIRRVRMINVPTDTTGSTQRRCIDFLCSQVTEAETTTNYMTDMVVEDCDLQGGNYGVILGGNIVGSANMSIFCDRLAIRRTTWDAGLKSAGYVGAGVQLGVGAQIGTAVLEDCSFKNSGDVSVEVDNCQYLIARNVYSLDPADGHFLTKNFRAPVDAASQTNVLEDCHAENVNFAPTSSDESRGFSITGTETFGHLVLRDCTYTNRANTWIASRGQAIYTYGAAFKKLTIRGFKSSRIGMSSVTLTANAKDMVIASTLAGAMYDLRDIHVRWSGSASGNVAIYAMELRSYDTGADASFIVDGFHVANLLTGAPSNGNTRYVLVGGGSGTLRGTFRRFSIEESSTSNDTQPKCFDIALTSTGFNGPVTFEDCDFTNAPSSSAVEFNVQTANAKPFLFFNGTKWKTYPKARTTDNSTFAAGTFTSATGNRFVAGYRALVTLSAGVAVTAADISLDDSTYVNVLTQASAAIASPVSFVLDNGNYLKLTFTTTAPTVSVIPFK